MSISPLVKTAITKLAPYTPCDIADALLKYNHPTGGFFPNLHQFSQFHAPNQRNSSIGIAYTVTYAPLDDPRPAITSRSYIDEVPPGAIVTIGLTRAAQINGAPYVRINNALYGGLMSTRAQYLGAKGTVVFGRIRDVNEHRDLGYPVFAYGTGICAHKGAVKLVAINEPLEVLVDSYYDGQNQKVEIISPGDIVVADENGVARIPVLDELLLERILEYVPKRVKADESVAEDIKNGKEAKASQKYHRSKI